MVGCNYDYLFETGQFVQTLEHRQILKTACPENFSWRQEWISDDELTKLAEPLCKSGSARVHKSYSHQISECGYHRT